MANATAKFTIDAVLPEHLHSLGDVLARIGTITLANPGDSYVTGGLALDLTEPFARIGLGRVLAITTARGVSLEYDSTNKKLLMYSAGVELSAAALAAGLTASPIPVIIFGR